MRDIYKTMSNIGKICSRYRKEAKISQDALAKICDCTRTNITEFENGRSHSLRLLIYYTEQFNIDFKELIKDAEN